MKVAGQIKISSNILQNATKKKPTIESQERDQQKIECISHLVPEKKKKKGNIIQSNSKSQSPICIKALREFLINERVFSFINSPTTAGDLYRPTPL